MPPHFTLISPPPIYCLVQSVLAWMCSPVWMPESLHRSWLLSTAVRWLLSNTNTASPACMALYLKKKKMLFPSEDFLSWLEMTFSSSETCELLSIKNCFGKIWEIKNSRAFKMCCLYLSDRYVQPLSGLKTCDLKFPTCKIHMRETNIAFIQLRDSFNQQ